MGTRGRLFDRLTQPGATAVSPQGATRVVYPVPAALQSTVRESIRVLADDAAEWYWTAPREDWDLNNNKDFGPLRLPFDNMWIEWSLPQVFLAGGEWYDTSGAARMFAGPRGMAITSFPPSTIASENIAPDFVYPDGTTNVLAWHFVRERFQQIEIPDAEGYLFVDDGGLVRGNALVAKTKRIDEREADMIWDDAKAAFVAISLMNCRNIGLTSHEPESRVTKKQRRPREPYLDYHTIRLPVKARTSTTAEKAEAMGGGIPLHKVRGHFKTYTPDNPLFGKATGTYWWGWHTRGDAAVGQVISSYDVGKVPV